MDTHVLLERRNPRAWGRKDRLAAGVQATATSTPATTPEEDVAMARFILAAHGAA